MYVLDTENGRIQVFTEGGRFLRQIGFKGCGEAGCLDWPTTIIINSDEVFVSEHNNHRVSILNFTTQGDYLTFFGKGVVQLPCDIAIY